ncbi:MAG: S-ribosylhomocysteine lyase, partial [Clostridia bacterium]|nr:S-ribosylhomocysteine lyase [Clostridia bacterium]
YWGPMGCLTGFYLILKGDRAPQEIYGLILNAFRAVENAVEVPGATIVNCGNYRMHDLVGAKRVAEEFVSYLGSNAGNGAIFEYPKTEKLITDGGEFFDS